MQTLSPSTTPSSSLPKKTCVHEINNIHFSSSSTSSLLLSPFARAFIEGNPILEQKIGQNTQPPQQQQQQIEHQNTKKQVIFFPNENNNSNDVMTVIKSPQTSASSSLPRYTQRSVCLGSTVSVDDHQSCYWPPRTYNPGDEKESSRRKHHHRRRHSGDSLASSSVLAVNNNNNSYSPQHQQQQHDRQSDSRKSNTLMMMTAFTAPLHVDHDRDDDDAQQQRQQQEYLARSKERRSTLFCYDQQQHQQSQQQQPQEQQQHGHVLFYYHHDPHQHQHQKQQFPLHYARPRNPSLMTNKSDDDDDLLFVEGDEDVNEEELRSNGINLEKEDHKIIRFPSDNNNNNNNKKHHVHGNDDEQEDELLTHHYPVHEVVVEEANWTYFNENWKVFDDQSITSNYNNNDNVNEDLHHNASCSSRSDPLTVASASAPPLKLTKEILEEFNNNNNNIKSNYCDHECREEQMKAEEEKEEEEEEEEEEKEEKEHEHKNHSSFVKQACYSHYPYSFDQTTLHHRRRLVEVSSTAKVMKNNTTSTSTSVQQPRNNNNNNLQTHNSQATSSSCFIEKEDDDDEDHNMDVTNDYEPLYMMIDEQKKVRTSFNSHHQNQIHQYLINDLNIPFISSCSEEKFEELTDFVLENQPRLSSSNDDVENNNSSNNNNLIRLFIGRVNKSVTAKQIRLMVWLFTGVSIRDFELVQQRPHHHKNERAGNNNNNNTNYEREFADACYIWVESQDVHRCIRNLHKKILLDQTGFIFPRNQKEIAIINSYGTALGHNLRHYGDNNDDQKQNNTTMKNTSNNNLNKTLRQAIIFCRPRQTITVSLARSFEDKLLYEDSVSPLCPCPGCHHFYSSSSLSSSSACRNYQIEMNKFHKKLIRFYYSLLHDDDENEEKNNEEEEEDFVSKIIESHSNDFLRQQQQNNTLKAFNKISEKMIANSYRKTKSYFERSGLLSDSQLMPYQEVCKYYFPSKNKQ